MLALAVLLCSRVAVASEAAGRSAGDLLAQAPRGAGEKELPRQAGAAVLAHGGPTELRSLVRREVANPVRAHQSTPGEVLGSTVVAVATAQGRDAGGMFASAARHKSARSGSTERAGLERSSAIPSVVYVTSYETELRGDLKRFWDANRAFFPPGVCLDYYNDRQLDSSASKLSASLEERGVVSGAYEAFRNLRPGAYRADLWRYMKLWADGGVYIDAKIKLLRNLSDWIRFDLAGPLHLVRDWGPGRLFNAIMAAAPGNPMLAQVIRFVVGQVRAKVYHGELPGRSGSLAITGPIALASGMGMQGVAGGPGSWHFSSFASRGAAAEPVIGAWLNLTIKPVNIVLAEVVLRASDNLPVATVDQALHRAHGGGSYEQVWANRQVYCDEPGPPCPRFS